MIKRIRILHSDELREEESRGLEELNKTLNDNWSIVHSQTLNEEYMFDERKYCSEVTILILYKYE